jgi:hypothetical protein
MKGFLSFIVIVAIFLVAITMVNINYQDNETISFKEEILDSKLLLINYELAMNKAMKGRLLTAGAGGTIDGNSSEVLEIITPPFTSCEARDMVLLAGGKSATVNLVCNTNVFVRGEIVFKNNFSDTITIKS